MSAAGQFVYRNLANITSLLGVAPLCLLFTERGYAYLPLLIVYNNVMDDLDGILAKELNIRSAFGALLDNVCDCVAHTIILMAVATHYGVVSLVFCLVPAIAIILRSVTRLDPSTAAGTGTPTNELMRHVLFLMLLERAYAFNMVPVLILVFVLHTVTMLVPLSMPHLIRKLTKTSGSIAGVNAALILAWLVPATAPLIASAFFGTYLYSLLVSVTRKLRATGGANNCD